MPIERPHATSLCWRLQCLLSVTLCEIFTVELYVTLILKYDMIKCKYANRKATCNFLCVGNFPSVIVCETSQCTRFETLTFKFRSRTLTIWIKISERNYFFNEHMYAKSGVLGPAVYSLYIISWRTYEHKASSTNTVKLRRNGVKMFMDQTDQHICLTYALCWANATLPKSCGFEVAYIYVQLDTSWYRIRHANYYSSDC